MYAIVEVCGKQYWVTPGETLRVDRIEAKAGDKLELKALWAGSEDKEEKKLEPTQKATVTAEVVKQMRGPKIIVFRKKPKSNRSRQMGHRQDLTELRIKDVSLN